MKPARSRPGTPPPREGWQRARRPEQKAVRREALLQAAASLLDERGVEGTTLSEIARRAGLSKANCYRYFQTREALLLTVTLEEARAWRTAFEARLAPLAGSADVDAVARAFARTAAGRPRLCMLLSSLSSVLERNVGVESVAAFKRSFHDTIFGAADAVRAALPELPLPQAEAFLRFMGLAISGAWPGANPNAAVAEVLARKEFAPMRLRLEPTLLAVARVLLRGLLAESAESERGR